jgi:hypothetical protein
MGAEMSNGTSFERKPRVRGGIVRITANDKFVGEIATCKWGFGLRLPGTYWHPTTGEPDRGGFTQKGFKRQKDAIAYVSELPVEMIERTAEFCAEHNLQMA